VRRGALQHRGDAHARRDRRARRRAARRLSRCAAGVVALSHFFDDVTSAAEVSAAIDAAEHEGPAVVVGIDGPSGAGKSTLARELAQLRDDVAIIDGDDFYRPLTESTRESLTPLEAVDLLFDWERLRDEALAPLLRGEEARYRRYDWEAGRMGDDVASVPAAGVVLVEGCYVARPALRGYLDVIVVVDAPREVCIARQLARGEDSADTIARWRAAEDWYFERQDPRRVADLVIDGS
jgi:uridine kinase